MGIEPTLPAWEAEVLPLNYTRISITSIYATDKSSCAQLIFYLRSLV